jgi:RHS repeat-associated protein
MYTQQEDLAYPSAFGRFAFTRTYNSQSNYTGPLGRGWTHPFDFELKEVQSGVMRVRNGTGNVRFYELGSASTDTYRLAAPARDTSTLIKHAEGYTETERNGLRREIDPAGRLHRIVTLAGWKTIFTYTDGILTAVTDPGGRTLTFSYTDGKLTQVEGPGGLVATYAYDAQGQLSVVADALGTRWTYSYSDTSPARLTSVRDANGNLVEGHTYDEEGRVTFTQGAGGSGARSLEYLDSGQTQDSGQTRVTDSLGRVTNYNFKVIGGLPLVTQIQGPCACGSTDSTFIYDPQGRRTGQIDAPGNTTSFDYDADGNLVKVTDALGQVTTLTYNSFGQVLSTTDPTAATTTLTYQEKTGFPLQFTNALGHSTTLTPSPNTLPGAVTDPLDHTTTFVYEATGLLESITDATGAKTTFSYGPAGRLLVTTDAMGGSTSYSYDARGRLLSVTDPIGAMTQFEYDAAGNRIGIKDPNGRVTGYTYDTANRLIAVTDPVKGRTTYSYDSEGNLLSVMDARGHTTTFQYDDLNRLISRADPLGASETFSYDAFGNLVARTSRNGQTITYTYDPLNRLVEKDLAGKTAVKYTYDLLGRLLTATDSNGTLAFTYDALGRVLTTTSQDGRTLTYSYDAAGNRVGLQDETGSLTVYGYDARNLLISLTDPRSGVFQFAYDNLGRRTRLTRPNGTSTSYTYDAASRLTGLTHRDRWRPFETLTYTYDTAGNRTGDARNHLRYQYTYDPLDQLTAVYRQGWRGYRHAEEAYTYDPVGNRLTGPDHQAYQYDVANRLTEDRTHAYAYDANGNLIEKRGFRDGRVTTYSYDAEDGLVRVVTSRTEVTFQYDPLGRRIEKRVIRWHDEDGDHEPDPDEEGPPRTVRYLYDQEDILATFNDAGREMARYTHGPGIDEPLAEVRRYHTRFYHADVLGSVIALTGSHGHPIRHYRYSAFGIPEDHRWDPQSYRYTGREWDREIGLYYSRARYYSARDGRFMQQDPMRWTDRPQPHLFDVADATNPYLYVTNSPTNFIDSLGLAKWHFDYSRAGERLIHYGKFRFNQLGQLVEHTGKVIGGAKGEALKALKYLRNVKPDFFRTPTPIIILDPCLVEPSLCRACGPGA